MLFPHRGGRFKRKRQGKEREKHGINEMSVSDEIIQIRLGLAERKSKELKKDNKKLQGEIVRLNGRIKELDRKANDSDSYQEQEILSLVAPF